MTTVATWHTWTADFWADFEQRIIDRAINELQKQNAQQVLRQLKNFLP